jgi:hypothetical protein
LRMKKRRGRRRRKGGAKRLSTFVKDVWSIVLRS